MKQFPTRCILIWTCVLMVQFAPAQSDDRADFVNGVIDFTGFALNTGSAQSRAFSFDDRTFDVSVGSDGFITFSENGQVLYQGDDFGEFQSYLFDLNLDVSTPPSGRRPPASGDPGESVKRIVGRVLTETPGGPIDDVFARVTLGKNLVGRTFVDLQEEEGALSEALAVVRYTRFRLNALEGNTYGVTLGAEHQVGQVRLGLMIPYDHIQFEGADFDVDALTFAPYVQYVLLQDPVSIETGPYLIYSRSFIQNNEDLNMWGAGWSASAEKYWPANIWTRVGAAAEYLETDVDLGDSSVVRGRFGGGVGAPIIPKRLKAEVFAYETLQSTEFLLGDKDYTNLGGEMRLIINNAFSVNVGYVTSIEHDDNESHSVYLGGLLLIR